MCRAALRAIVSPEHLQEVAEAAEASSETAGEGSVSVSVDWPAASLRVDGTPNEVADAAASVLYFPAHACFFSDVWWVGL